MRPWKQARIDVASESTKISWHILEILPVVLPSEEQNMKTLLKNLLRRAGYDIRRAGAPSRDDPYAEQRLLLTEVECPVIFDVGANVGNMVAKYKAMFPQARIHAFEPFKESYRKLQERCQGMDGVVLNQTGAGDRAGRRQFHANKVASTNSLLPASKEGLATSGGDRFSTEKLIEIELTTLDDYTDLRGVDRIDLLKLDVQGSEPEVLNGASRLLERKAVGLIFTEIMVTKFYEGQQSLHEALAMYDRLGFRLYNFYDLSAFEGPLRQLDAIFVQK